MAIERHEIIENFRSLTAIFASLEFKLSIDIQGMFFNMVVFNTKTNIKILTCISILIPPILPHKLICYGSEE